MLDSVLQKPGTRRHEVFAPHLALREFYLDQAKSSCKELSKAFRAPNGSLRRRQRRNLSFAERALLPGTISDTLTTFMVVTRDLTAGTLIDGTQVAS
jgi:hypothetical protein